MGFSRPHVLSMRLWHPVLNDLPLKSPQFIFRLAPIAGFFFCSRDQITVIFPTIPPRVSLPVFFNSYISGSCKIFSSYWTIFSILMFRFFSSFGTASSGPVSLVGNFLPSALRPTTPCLPVFFTLAFWSVDHSFFLFSFSLFLSFFSLICQHSPPHTLEAGLLFSPRAYFL